ncbi:MAG: Tn7 transposase TnsA N-terminal domain-containing protein, partial [Thermomicrobiales bacterium]
LFQVAMNDMAYLSPRIAFRFLLSLSGCKAQQSSSHMREMAEKLKEYRSSYRESLRSRKRQGGLFNFLLRETYWSKRQESATGSPARFLEAGRAREVQLAREHAGTYYSEKLRRNVQFESALEMKFLLRIEQLDEITAYQEQPFSLGYQLDGVQRRYYPDVLLQLQDGQMIVAEVKPLWQMAFRENLAKWSALKIYCELQGLGLLITDGKKSIRSLIDYQVPPSLQDVILDELRQGPMPLRRLIQLRTIRSPQLKSVAAMVLQQKLVWSGTSLAITQAEIAK